MTGLATKSNEGTMGGSSLASGLETACLVGIAPVLKHFLSQPPVPEPLTLLLKGSTLCMNFCCVGFAGVPRL